MLLPQQQGTQPPGLRGTGCLIGGLLLRPQHAGTCSAPHADPSHSQTGHTQSTNLAATYWSAKHHLVRPPLSPAASVAANLRLSESSVPDSEAGHFAQTAVSAPEPILVLAADAAVPLDIE